MKRNMICFLAFLMVAALADFRSLAAKSTSQDGGAEKKVETEQEKQRRKLLGVWQDNYQGKRTMTLNEDGSGTMLVELSGLQATLFASKLRFDMKWSLEGKKLTKKTVGGEPRPAHIKPVSAIGLP